MEFSATPNSKNIIATLRIVTADKSELKFLLMLYFNASSIKEHILQGTFFGGCFEI